MKKLLSLAMAAIMCLSLGSMIAYADTGTDLSDEAMKAFLQERGFPREYLDSLISQQIENVYNTVYNTDSYLYNYKEYTVDMEGEPTILRGNIPTSDLNFHVSITVSEVVRNNITYISQVNVIVTYEWLDLPIFRNDDMMSVNWDSSLLTYAGDSTFSAHDYYYVLNNWITFQTWNQPAIVNQGGLGNYIKLASSEFGALNLRGDLIFSMVPKEEYSMTKTGGYNTTIAATYAHDKWNQSLSLSITGTGAGGVGGGVTISGAATDAYLSTGELLTYGKV